MTTPTRGLSMRIPHQRKADVLSPWPLNCPVCGLEATLSLRPNGKPASLACPHGHRYDAARQGYLNLITGRGSSLQEDTPAMVASRERWLGSGAYAPLAQRLGALAVSLAPATVGGPLLLVDTGSGTGYYSAAVLDALEAAGHPAHAVDMDLSRAGAQRAAHDARVVSLVWDTTRDWPLADASAHVLLDVFAPRNEPEFRRVLVPGGVALVAVPLPEHLAALATDAGLLGIDASKEERLAALFSHGWEALEVADVHLPLSLPPELAADLAHMGPAGHHRSRDQILASLGTRTRTADGWVRIHAYRRL